LKGSPVSIIEGVMANPSSGSAQFAISANGLLAYAAGSGEFDERSLVAVDRQGKVTSLSEIHRAFEDMCPSPDGRRVALTIEGPTWGIWIFDFDRGTLTRFTFDNDSRDPLWSPDGKRIAYGSFRDGRYGIYWKNADGSGKEERLTPPSEKWHYPLAFTPDSRMMLYGEEGPAFGNDVWSISLDAERKATPVFNSRFNEGNATLSPDGRWLAYSSDESGRLEVYVQAWPTTGGKWLISADGGERPRWSPDGRELYYRKGTKLMGVSIEARPTFAAGKARLLFEGEFQEAGHDYDLLDRGSRFLFIKELEQKSNASQINIVLNWFDEVKRLMAKK
jgi:Tol biopolymer transport system component